MEESTGKAIRRAVGHATPARESGVISVAPPGSAPALFPTPVFPRPASSDDPATEGGKLTRHRGISERHERRVVENPLDLGWIPSVSLIVANVTFSIYSTTVRRFHRLYLPRMNCIQQVRSMPVKYRTLGRELLYYDADPKTRSVPVVTFPKHRYRRIEIDRKLF